MILTILAESSSAGAVVALIAMLVHLFVGSGTPTPTPRPEPTTVTAPQTPPVEPTPRSDGKRDER